MPPRSTPTAARARISRHRLALVMFFLVAGIVNLVAPALRWLLAAWPAPLQMTAAIAIQVALMSYVIMPVVHRRLGRWLSGQRAERASSTDRV